ncbi:MAG: AMP-binding protein, partial [Methyloceanibacter sp.]|uniref:AMP-binding protein n=1 Tax=Methyloceanibacter sp. TaxID=1965321 RepID=UPI003D9AC6E7
MEHKHYKLESVKVPKKWKDRAFIGKDEYEKLYKKSVKNPDKFWAKQAKRLDWIKPFTQVKNTSFAYPDVSIKWFEDGTLNVAANCIDRHLKKRGDKVAIIWEPDDPNQAARHITYRELHEEVCRFANVLKALGVNRGDRVTIYLPMIPEAAYAMLACARIGAIHSVVFGGFSPDAIAGRIQDCQSRFVVTADEGVRGGRKVPLKANADEAIRKVGGVEKVIVVGRTGAEVPWTPGRDVWLHEETAKVGTDCVPEEMGAEDPLFILYTSGSTG